MEEEKKEEKKEIIVLDKGIIRLCNKLPLPSQDMTAVKLDHVPIFQIFVRYHLVHLINSNPGNSYT